MAPSHAEIWDDSALVDSWNEALSEYKKYHSVEARGEKVDEVLARSTDDVDDKHDEIPTDTGDPRNSDPTKSVHTKNGPSSENVRNGKQEDHLEGFQKLPSDSQVNVQEPDTRQPALPQHLIGQVHDESLKNLLMSWYYAGYYTGLYEGQQQSKSS